jgi:hypothetical protein
MLQGAERNSSCPLNVVRLVSTHFIKRMMWR